MFMTTRNTLFKTFMLVKRIEIRFGVAYRLHIIVFFLLKIYNTVYTIY